MEWLNIYWTLRLFWMLKLRDYKKLWITMIFWLTDSELPRNILPKKKLKNFLSKLPFLKNMKIALKTPGNLLKKLNKPLMLKMKLLPRPSWFSDNPKFKPTLILLFCLMSLLSTNRHYSEALYRLLLMDNLMETLQIISWKKSEMKS